MNTTTNNRQSRTDSGMSQKRRFISSPSREGGSQHGGFSRQRSNFNGGNRDKFGNSGRSRGGNFGGNRGGGFNRKPRKMPTFDPSQFINTNPVDTVEEKYKATHTFKSLGIRPQLLQTITKMGIVTPSPIQDQIIPTILKKRDVIGLAETGTGKTAAFLIPLIEHTLNEPKRQTLILAPTRELAIQIEKELHDLSAGFRIYSVTCVGGANIRPQIQALRQMNHFVIGTPGRILDLIQRRHFKPSQVSTVVLDEADRMLDMGFINDIKTILTATPRDRETLLFSATISRAAEDLMHNFLHDPVMVSVKKKDVTNSIEQNVIAYSHNSKFETLLAELDKPEYKRVIVFGAMKHSVEKLAIQLNENHVKTESIHGNKSHGQRQRALTRFKNGSVQVLVATDVAARGIHVDDVSHVINYDLPNTFDDYVHRIGRTGRGSKKGKALTFIPEQDRSRRY
jgi:superfamily II DNA/RNA helicase